MRVDSKKEVWVQVPGFEGRYEVSTYGNVRSLLSARNTPWHDGPLQMRFRPHDGGYMRVSLRRRDYYVHRVVLEAFIGYCPDGFQCAHMDGNPKNNHVSNLAWVSPKTNQGHRFIHGTNLNLDRHPMAKLTTEKVERIKAIISTGVSQRAIARSFGVSQSCVSMAVSGRTWEASR